MTIGYRLEGYHRPLALKVKMIKTLSLDSVKTMSAARTLNNLEILLFGCGVTDNADDTIIDACQPRKMNDTNCVRPGMI